VTPGRVEVLALSTDDEEAIAGFLDRKRQWLFDTIREMDRITAARHAVPRFMTGAKIPYRGRKMPLVVRRSDAERIEITFRNGFIVDLPAWAGVGADQLVASELKLWLKQRARRDARDIAGDHASRFGLKPRSIRVTDFATGWGSCGAEGNILINWHLIFAPRRVFEYVVLHELAHLRHRSHGEAFWDFLSTLMPSYQRSADWLDQQGHQLTSDWLKLPDGTA
jgi:predicted metal-dependent hydrolase